MKMMITIKVRGFPEVEKVIGGTTAVIEVNGNTFGDLLDAIEGVYGKEVRNTLLVQVLKNGKEWIKLNDLSCPLQDGDYVSFLHMIAGG